MTKLQRILPSERGQDLVEFALILPLLLLLLLGIIEFGITIFTYNTIANASREVARYGSVHPDPEEIKTFIQDGTDRWTIGLWGDQIDFDYTLTEASISSTVQVTTVYTYNFISAPMIRVVGGDGELPLRAIVTMDSEVPVTET
jgi:Flp pilus assembly protein TadG